MVKLQKLEKLEARAGNRLSNRMDARDELATHAIETLSILGYARTGMRDIAEQSERSVGSLTYYFDDKIDLICHCVQLYKEKFIAEIDVAIRRGQAQDCVIQSVAKAFATAVANDAEKHRLWYDIRSQSLFESRFREVVSEIEENLILLVTRITSDVDVSAGQVKSIYFILDGLFRMALQEQLEKNTNAASDLEQQIISVLSASM